LPGGGFGDLDQPPAVPKLAQRPLSTASYVQLAKEWKQYIAKHGESVDALVNLGMAYDYSGQEEAALNAARRAFRVDSDDPKALTFFAKMLAVYKGDEKKALVLLERCLGLAPDYEDALIMLATTYMRRGKFNKSEEIFKTLFSQRVIPRPLQDYAYNMLVGLPPDAVLITNGDNDTFPPLALQAGMDFRKDVVIINRSLLNLKAYAEAVFKSHPRIRPKGPIEPDENEILSSTLIKRMLLEHRVPLYFAATLNFDSLFSRPENLVVEGVNLRASGKGLGEEESAVLFLEKYRLDSATDWNFAWDLMPAVSKLMKNYVGGIIKTVNKKHVDGATRRRLLDKAEAIAGFHDMAGMEKIIRSLRKR
jgi:tetratricopeptide (TPR) repeat protein